MLIKIACPKCQVEGSISLVESTYEGPYKCWKCRELYSIRLEKNKLKSIEPLSEEEFQKIQEIEMLKKKMGRK